MLKLFIYRLEDVEDENFDNVKAIDVIEGETNDECEQKAEELYCSNDFGGTYCEMELE